MSFKHVVTKQHGCACNNLRVKTTHRHSDGSVSSWILVHNLSEAQSRSSVFNTVQVDMHCFTNSGCTQSTFHTTLYPSKKCAAYSSQMIYHSGITVFVDHIGTPWPTPLAAYTILQHLFNPLGRWVDSILVMAISSIFLSLTTDTS